MSCSGRYASAMDYATFLGLGHHVSGVESSGNATPHNILRDDEASFLEQNLESGMPIKNLTDASQGRIITVNDRSLTAALLGGTHNAWKHGDVYLIVSITARQTSVIEAFLDLAAPSIHAALGAVGACDCDWAPWAVGLLAKLNIVEAWVVHHAPCGTVNISDRERAQMYSWLDRQYQLIREGRVELCAGHTGADVPTAEIAEHSYSSWRGYVGILGG